MSDEQEHERTSQSQNGSTIRQYARCVLTWAAGRKLKAQGITFDIAFTSALVGFVRGGLAMVNIAASMFFAEISGSAVADVAALGSILIPAMKKRGYSKEFAAAVTSSSASLAIIIPPSIPMILYAVMQQQFVRGIAMTGIK